MDIFVFDITNNRDMLITLEIYNVKAWLLCNLAIVMKINNSQELARYFDGK